MRHLDARTWAALQQADDPELRAHLAEGCDVCDAFLSTVPGLEARVDAALLSVGPARARASELTWAKFKRAGVFPPRRWLAAAAAVLLVGAAVALGWPRDPSTPEGLKGAPRSQLSLRGAFEPREGPLTFFDSGARVAASATVVVQAHSSVAGPARLFLQRGQGAPQELTSLEVTAGVQELARADHSLLGVALHDEAGPVTLWLVAGEQPFDAADALAAIAGDDRRGLAVANLRVDVVP